MQNAETKVKKQWGKIWSTGESQDPPYIQRHTGN